MVLSSLFRMRKQLFVSTLPFLVWFGHLFWFAGITPFALAQDKNECADISGQWDVTESVDITCCAQGECETWSEQGSGLITMKQSGCNVSYRVPQFDILRTGSISGDTIKLTGPFVVFQPGVDVTNNSITLTGTLENNTLITLQGIGEASGSYQGGIPFTCDGTSTAQMTREPQKVVVILIHGWRGSPADWSSLTDRLRGEDIDYITFDYSPALGDPEQYAQKLKNWIEKYRTDSGYTGKFDIVCHSMGALVSRWYMERLDGARNIRQWIGIAPVNHGAPLADDSNLVNLLNKVFFFIPGYILGSEPAVKAMRTKSGFLAKLNYGKDAFDPADWMTAKESFAPGVIYHLIVGGKPSSRFTNGRTRNIRKLENGQISPYYWTRIGDGLVPVTLSKLKGVEVDYFEGIEHATISRDPGVISRVIQYLKEPLTSGWGNDPAEGDEDYQAGFATGGLMGILHVILF